jgi:hypothetical protein
MLHQAPSPQHRTRPSSIVATGSIGALFLAAGAHLQRSRARRYTGLVVPE